MKHWIKITLWSVFSISVIVLLYYTQKAQSEIVVGKPDIKIHVDGEYSFLTKDEVKEQLRSAGLLYEGQTIAQLDIEKIERYLASISQVKHVKVFRLLGGDLKIDISMRKPIARIFNKYGKTYYLDDEGVTMQISLLHASRTLVVTGDIEDERDSLSVPEIINNDSLKSIRKLDDIYRISNYVCKDPLFHSLVGQIHLEKNGDFILVPLVGDQKIVFGSALSEKEVAEKFKKLRIFYKEAIPYEGWDKYAEISLKYEDQIVCKKKKTDG